MYFYLVKFHFSYFECLDTKQSAVLLTMQPYLSHKTTTPEQPNNLGKCETIKNKTKEPQHDMKSMFSTKDRDAALRVKNLYFVTY